MFSKLLTVAFIAASAPVVQARPGIIPANVNGIWYVPVIEHGIHSRSAHVPTVYGEPIQLPMNLDLPSLAGNESIVSAEEPLVKRALKDHITKDICYRQQLHPFSLVAVQILKVKCEEGATCEPQTWHVVNHEKCWWRNGILIARYYDEAAFICSSGGRQPCNAQEIDETVEHLVQKCGGREFGGAVQIKRWCKSIGYRSFPQREEVDAFGLCQEDLWNKGHIQPLTEDDFKDTTPTFPSVWNEITNQVPIPWWLGGKTMSPKYTTGSGWWKGLLGHKGINKPWYSTGQTIHELSDSFGGLVKDKDRKPYDQ